MARTVSSGLGRLFCDRSSAPSSAGRLAFGAADRARGGFDLQFLRRDEFRVRMDLLDPDLRQFLAVAFRPPVLFPPLLLEDEDLVSLEIFHDLGPDHRVLDDRGPDEDLAFVLYQKDLVEVDLLALFGAELLGLQEVAFLDAILFSACLDHCVHISTLF